MTEQSLWYDRIHEAFQGDPIRLAALAVLSPQLTVRDNVRALIELERLGHTRVGFPANAAKAAAILHTRDPEPFVRGPKVIEFWRSLLLQPGAICIDRHMLHWAGCGHAWSKRNVNHAKEAVRKYARARGLQTFRAQAEIWCTVAAIPSRQDPREIVRDLSTRIGR